MILARRAIRSPVGAQTWPDGQIRSPAGLSADTSHGALGRDATHCLARPISTRSQANSSSASNPIANRYAANVARATRLQARHRNRPPGNTETRCTIALSADDQPSRPTLSTGYDVRARGRCASLRFRWSHAAEHRRSLLRLLSHRRGNIRRTCHDARSKHAADNLSQIGASTNGRAVSHALTSAACTGAARCSSERISIPHGPGQPTSRRARTNSWIRKVPSPQ